MADAGPSSASSSGCVVRTAQGADLAALLPMMVDFNRFEGISWDPVQGAVPLRRLLGAPELGLVMLIYGASKQGQTHDPGKPAGYAVVTYGYDLEFGGRDAFLTELYLVPEARGQGIGRSALKQIVHEAAAHGVRALHLQVRTENTAALRLYQTAGFTGTTRQLLSRVLVPPDTGVPVSRTHDLPPVSPSAPRSLTPADAGAYAALRREMLLDAPWAFLASPEDDFAADPAAVAARLSEPESRILAIEDAAGHLLAAAGVVRSRRPKTRHHAVLWGVYTISASRGSGLGAAVVRAAVETARAWDGVGLIALSVSERAESALRLYRALGFEPWGTEPDALRVDGKSYAEVHLALKFM